jgi:cytochrome c
MKIKSKALIFSMLVSLPQVLIADDKVEELQKKGAAQFSKCYFCHSLKASVHMTGPSLAGIWNAKAASQKDFELYSDSLKKSGLVWDEKTMQNWLRNPKHLVPGTSMTYDFAGDDESLENLIEFLKVATVPDGYKTVLNKKWISKEFADGQRPRSWIEPSDDQVVEKIEYCKSIYTIYRKASGVSKYWEENINLRVSASDRNGGIKSIRILPTGSLGDRFLILFPSFVSMNKSIKPCK